MESGAFKSPIIKNVPAILDCYVHFLSIKTNKIVKLLVYYGLTKFYPLVEKGVNIHVYKKGDYLDTTSQSDIKTGVEDIPNIKLDDTNIAGDAKIQYIFVLIPPQIIKSCDCVEIQKGTDYNKNTAILNKTV